MLVCSHSEKILQRHMAHVSRMFQEKMSSLAACGSESTPRSAVCHNSFLQMLYDTLAFMLDAVKGQQLLHLYTPGSCMKSSAKVFEVLPGLWCDQSAYCQKLCEGIRDLPAFVLRDSQYKLPSFLSSSQSL